MQAGSALELPAVLCLVDRIQRLLAAYRLWLQELRGRLDVAFLQIAGLRAQGPGFQEIREEVARTVLNFNSRLQDTEDDLEQVLERQAIAFRSFELRLQHQYQVLLFLAICFLQLLRLLVV